MAGGRAVEVRWPEASVADDPNRHADPTLKATVRFAELLLRRAQENEIRNAHRDVRDQVVDFVRRWSEKTEIGVGRFPPWLGVTASKFYDWRQRYGRVNEHNGWIPRDFWLEAWEKEAIIDFHQKNPLQQAGLLSRWKSKPSRKGTGFEQPPQPHQHWHIDVSYINVSGTFYYLCSVLDGYSRFLVHWDLRESMREADIEIIRERLWGRCCSSWREDELRESGSMKRCAL